MTAGLTPGRVQIRRTKGWRMPEGCVSVGRPSRWGNPFKVGERAGASFGGEVVRDRGHAVEVYLRYLRVDPIVVSEARRLLRGRDLACWCPLDQPCHADVLLEVANG